MSDPAPGDNPGETESAAVAEERPQSKENDSDTFVDDQVEYDSKPAGLSEAEESDEDENKSAKMHSSKASIAGLKGVGVEDDDEALGRISAAAAKPVEEMITFAGEDRDTNERRQAAFSFAHFSTEEETQFAIVKMKRKYGLHAVLGLLNSGDHICQRYAALCFGNIAAHAELRKDLVAFGVLDHLLPIALHGGNDLDTQRYAIMAVANLAADYDTHKLLMKNMPAILDLIDSSDRDLHECAVLTVQNVSSNKKLTKKLKIIIGPLVNMIANPLMDVESITHAVSALRGLTSDDNLKIELLRLNAHKELVNLVDTIDRADVLVEIAATIAGLANLIEAHAELLQPSSINAIMVLALMDLNPEVQMHAANTLASLASNPDAHPNIVYANGIDNLVHLAMSRDPRVRQGATRALANLSSNRAYQGDMIHAGALDVITAALKDNDSASLFFSCIMCAIMSENVQYHRYICVKQILQPLSLLVTSMEQDNELTRYALLSLSNLAANIASHGLIMDELQMQLTVFFELASSKDSEVQRYFAMLLSNLAANEALHEFLSSRASFQAVQNILGTDSMETAMSALSFIVTMLRDNVTRETFAAVSVKQILDIAQRWPDPPFQMAVIEVLSNVTKAPKVRTSYKWYRNLPLIEHFMGQESPDVQQEALRFLLNICDSEEVQRTMIGTKLLDFTVKAVRKGTMSQQSLGVHILSRLCAGVPEILEELKRMRVIQVIAPFVRSPHAAFRKYAFNALGSFASHEHTPVDLMDVNIVKSFLMLCESSQGDLEERRCCMYALANMAFHLINQEHFTDAGPFVFRGLPAFIETGDVELLQHTSLFLINIVSTMYTHSMFAVQSVMEAFIAVARCLDPTAKVQALSALSTLALHEKNVQYMLQAGITQFLLQEGGEWRKREVACTRQMAQLLNQLTVYDLCVKNFGEERGVQILVHMLDHSDVQVRRLVARTFANIAYFPQFRQFIVQDGVFPLLKCLNDNDREIRHSASWAIGHILSFKDVQLKIARASEDDIFAQLIESADVDVQLACVWALANLHHEACPLGPNNSDIHRLDNPSDDLLQRLSRTALSKRVDSRISKYAIIAICNYTSVPRYHFYILRNCGDVVKRIFELAMRNDPEIRYCLALMLANLAGNLDNHEFIATHVEMGRLSILVGCDDEETQGHAIATVSGLAVTERNAKRIVESGLLIPQMSRECNSPHISVQRSVAAAFLNLAQHDCILETLVEQDLVAGLLSLLKSNQENTQLPAARTLNIAMGSAAAVASLLRQDLGHISRTLWDVVAEGSPKVSAQIIRVLALLSTMEGAEPILINEHGIRGLVQCARIRAQGENDESNCEFHSAVMIRKLCSMKDVIGMMVDLGTIEALLFLCESRTGSQGVHELAITSLEDLLDHERGRQMALQDPHIIDALMKLLVSDKAAVHRHALGCVIRLCFDEDWAKLFRARGGLKVIYKSARHKAYPIRAFSAWTMAILSSYRSFFEELIHERALKTLLYLADHDPEDARIALHVAVVLGNLSQYSAMIGSWSASQGYSDQKALQPFNLESSGMVPLFVRFLTSNNPLIASLAFMGMASPSKSGPGLIYVLRDDAMDLLAKLGASGNPTVLRMLAMALNVISSNSANYPYLKGRNLTGFDALFQFAQFDNVALRWAALKSVNNMITEASFNVNRFVLKPEYVTTLVEVANANVETDFGMKARFMALGILAQLTYYQAYHDLLCRPDVLQVLLHTLRAAQRTISKTQADRLNRTRAAKAQDDDGQGSDHENDPSQTNEELDLGQEVIADDPIVTALLRRERDAVAEANAVSALSNLVLNLRCHLGVIESNAFEILTDFINCSLANVMSQAMGAQALANLLFSLTSTMVKQSRFFSLANIADIMQALLKYGAGEKAMLTERFMALALCRLSCQPEFKVYAYDRPFFESRCLPAMLRSPDGLTQKFTFISLINIILKAESIVDLMEKENFVSLLLVYIQSKDRSTKWLCLLALVNVVRTGQGTRYLSKDEYVRTLIDLCFSDDVPIFTCVAEIVHSFVKYEGSVALRGKSDNLIPALAHISTCPDERTAMLGSETLGMFLDSREAMDMLLECSSEGFGAVLTLLRSSKAKLRVQALYSLAAISHNPEYANAIVDRRGLRLITDLILADTIGDPIDCIHILRNVARNTINHVEFVNCNGIECLETLSKHRSVHQTDANAEQLILHALSDIAHYFENYHLSPERLQILVRAMIYPIRDIHRPGGSNVDEPIVELSVFALNCLLVSNDCKRFAADFGAIEPLAHIYETTLDIRVRRVTLALLLSLAEYSGSQVAFVKAPGGMRLLKDFVIGKDLALKKKGCRALAQLTSNANVHMDVIEAGMMPIILATRSHPDLECRRLALNAFLSLLDNVDVQAALENDDDVVDTVVALSKFGVTSDIKRQASKILISIANHKKPTQIARRS